MWRTLGLTVLLFGFEEYLEFNENPTRLLAESLDGREVGSQLVRGLVLPVNYSAIEEKIVDAVERHRPSLVVGFGVAPGRERITPEKVALNYRHAAKADNAGRKAIGEPIDPSQPDALFSTLPVEGLADYLSAKGLPAALSLTAGGYLCNNAMFIIVRESRSRGFGGGFVHVPCHSEWVASERKGYPSLPMSTIEAGAKLTLEYCLAHPTKKFAP